MQNNTYNVYADNIHRWKILKESRSTTFVECKWLLDRQWKIFLTVIVG